MQNINRPKKILVIGPSWLGDMIMAQALFKVLKTKFNCVIDVVAPSWCLQIVERMPEVSSGIVQSVAHGKLGLTQRYSLAKNLRGQHYDQAIVLTNTWKSALLPFWAQIPLRTGWLGEMRWGLLNDVRYLNKKELPMMMQRYVALAYNKDEVTPSAYPYPTLRLDQTSMLATLNKFKLDTKRKKIIALCPGSALDVAKRWPENYYAKVANTKIAEGWEVWLFGSKQDEPVLAQIKSQLAAGSCHSFGGDVQLTEKVDLMAAAQVVISNDSGLMHMASALDKYLLAIYGPTSPEHTPPFGKNAHIIRKKIACSPCFKKTCPLQHHNCMREITPEQVLARLKQDGW